MKNNANESIAALFNNAESAEKAYNTLLELGYHKDDIGIIMSEKQRLQYDTPNSNSAADFSTTIKQQAAAGSAVGGALGFLAGAIVGSGVSIALPGLGIVAAGPVTAALVGAGTGFASGILGAFANSGIPEDMAEVYHAAIKAGSILLIVKLKHNEKEGRNAEYKSIAQRWGEYGGRILSNRESPLETLYDESSQGLDG